MSADDPYVRLPDHIELTLAEATLVLEVMDLAIECMPNPRRPRRSDDQLVLRTAAAAGHTIRSVRAIFEEGERIFEASKIRSQSHVQIAVRDLTAILEIEEVAW